MIVKRSKNLSVLVQRTLKSSLQNFSAGGDDAKTNRRDGKLPDCNHETMTDKLVGIAETKA